MTGREVNRQLTGHLPHSAFLYWSRLCCDLKTDGNTAAKHAKAVQKIMPGLKRKLSHKNIPTDNPVGILVFIGDFGYAPKKK